MMSTIVLRNASKPTPTRLRVLALYKELHRLGREYPDPEYNFHGKLRGLFEKNKSLKDEADIEKAIKMGEYIRNETLALYSLRKYRHLKRMYPADSQSELNFSKHDPALNDSHPKHPNLKSASEEHTPHSSQEQKQQQWSGSAGDKPTSTSPSPSGQGER